MPKIWLGKYPMMATGAEVLKWWILGRKLYTQWTLS